MNFLSFRGISALPVGHISHILVKDILGTIYRTCTEVRRNFSPASKCKHDILCSVITKAGVPATHIEA